MGKAKGTDLRADRAAWCVWMRSMEKVLKLPAGTDLPTILKEAGKVTDTLEYLTTWIETMRVKNGYQTLEEFYEAAVYEDQRQLR